MCGMIRKDASEEQAHSGITRAGDFCSPGRCAGNTGGPVGEQANSLRFQTGANACRS